VGAPVVATGHYAQVFRDAAGWHLGRGVDPDKDQSYFLYNLTQEELAETLFPVGGMLKPDVREIARRHGLVTAEKPDSQDICFVSGSVSSFVNRIGRSHPQPGAIQNLLGETVGHHEGVHHFTVGQRRGLQIGGEAEPLYVVRIEPESRTVVVGPRSALENRRFSVSAASWCTPKPPVVGETIEGIVQVRHRHKGELSRITRVDPDKFQVEFIENWVAVSPGQAAVVYSVDNRTVLGGGRIERQKGGL
jgi:tRNA-specific 2-thiouridylase